MMRIEALLPCTALALCCWLLAVSPCHAKATNADLNTHDFGNIMVGSEVRHAFIVTNKGNKALAIKSFRSSSSDLQIVSCPNSIAPHENGRLEVRWIPSGPGSIEHEINLETNRAGRNPLTYRVKGTVEGSPSNALQGDNNLNLPPELLTRKPKKRDSTLATPVESILPKSRKYGEATFVDVRNRSDFEQFRIPGSINLPLFAIKTKTYLKGKSIILVNEGCSSSELEEECRRLRSSGFMVSILEGGLNRWRLKGGPLEGNALSQKELNRVSPQVFFKERHYENWVVLCISSAQMPEVSRLLPEAVPFNLPPEPEKAIAAIKSLHEKDKGKPFPVFLVVGESETQEKKLERLFHKGGIVDVFFLKGGIEAYGSFLQQQARLLRGETPLKRTVRKCPSCP